MMNVLKKPEDKAVKTSEAADPIQAAAWVVVPLVARSRHRGTMTAGTNRWMFWKETA